MAKIVETPPAHLRLVRRPATDAAEDKRAVPVQGTLFPNHGVGSICIVDMPTVSDDEFAFTVRSLAPTQILDLRAVPAFDLGRLNRNRAFELFEAQGSSYVDVAGQIGVRSRWDARLNVDFVVKFIASRSGGGAGPANGPIMILMDDSDAVRNAAVHLHGVLPPIANQTWEIHVLMRKR